MEKTQGKHKHFKLGRFFWFGFFCIQAPYKGLLEQSQQCLSFKYSVNKLFTITWQTLQIGSLTLFLIDLNPHHLNLPKGFLFHEILRVALEVVCTSC